MSAPRLPQPTNIRSVEDLDRWAKDVHRSMQGIVDDLWAQAATGYMVSNFTILRELDADALGIDGELGQVIDVLCTLIDDLKTGKQGTILG